MAIVRTVANAAIAASIVTRNCGFMISVDEFHHGGSLSILLFGRHLAAADAQNLKLIILRMTRMPQVIQNRRRPASEDCRSWW